MLFECEVCNAEIEEHAEDPAKLEAGRDALSQLMEQTAPLLRLLRQIDSVKIPYFDPVEFLRQKQSAQSNLVIDDETNMSMSSNTNLTSTNRSSASVNIDIQIEDQELSKVVHELPSWYTHSTITGEFIQTSESNVKESTTSLTPSMDTSHVESIEKYYETLPNKRTSQEVEEEHEEETVADADEMITIGNQTKSLSQVTEEDKSAMTPDEYSAYYEAYMNSLQ